jgi:hypothetical protein
MLEKINRKNINIDKSFPYIFVVVVIIAIGILGCVVVNAFANANQQAIDKTTGQPIKSSSDILIASWNANQTKLNSDILSDIKSTGSKIVDGTISSGTTITTTRADFLSHLSNKTVVYISPASKIAVRPVGVSMGTEIRLVNPLDYSVIVGGVTYRICISDNRYSLMKLKNESLIDVIWISDTYWWG